VLPTLPTSLSRHRDFSVDQSLRAVRRGALATDRGRYPRRAWLRESSIWSLAVYRYGSKWIAKRCWLAVRLV